jgi:hypothetical protein
MFYLFFTFGKCLEQLSWIQNKSSKTFFSSSLTMKTHLLEKKVWISKSVNDSKLKFNLIFLMSVYYIFFFNLQFFLSKVYQSLYFLNALIFCMKFIWYELQTPEARDRNSSVKLNGWQMLGSNKKVLWIETHISFYFIHSVISYYSYYYYFYYKRKSLFIFISLSV